MRELHKWAGEERALSSKYSLKHFHIVELHNFRLEPEYSLRRYGLDLSKLKMKIYFQRILRFFLDHRDGKQSLSLSLSRSLALSSVS